MLKISTYASLLVLVASTLFADEYDWGEPNGQLSIQFVSSKTDASVPGVTGFAINQVGLQLQLMSSASIIERTYPDVSSDWFTSDVDGKRITVEPTVSEVWKIVSKDPSVVALVPIGYSETAGGTEIAGFYRIKGEDSKSIFSAPNMDTVLCLNDRVREINPKKYFNVPFLFDVNLGGRFNYSYEDDLKSVELDHLGEKDRWKRTFNTCEDMIQIGFRLIEPRHIFLEDGLTERVVTDLPVDLGVRTFPLTAMMFDRNARFSFVRFSDESPTQAAEILSSEEFQPEGCKKKLGGAQNCEIWSIMLTAFDDAALFVRSEPAQETRIFGKQDVISPAVLILRNFDTENTRDNEDENEVTPTTKPMLSTEPNPDPSQ